MSNWVEEVHELAHKGGNSFSPIFRVIVILRLIGLLESVPIGFISPLMYAGWVRIYPCILLIVFC